MRTFALILMLSTSAAAWTSGATAEAVDFVLTMGGGMAAGVERPPPQHLRVPLALLARPIYPQAKAGDVIDGGGAAMAATYSDGRFVPMTNPDQAIAISVEITAAGYQERVRQIDPDVLPPKPVDMGPDAPPLQPRTKGPKLPFGLHELVPPAGARAYETIYFGEDSQLGFVQVRCFDLAVRGVRHCGATTELTRFLTLTIGIDEDQLPDWRNRMLAARKLTLPFVVTKKIPPA